jgi:PKD repeat protein
VQFDGSASCAGPVNPGSDDPCPVGHGAIVEYRWSFGDGSTAQGAVVSHSFDDPQTYGVTLTVTNDRGGSGSVTQAVTVEAGEAPTADFVFSPTAPVVEQLVQFNASASRAAPGRTIVQYIWNWGDGDDDTGMLDEHDYFLAGVYTVTLTVVDDAGQQGTVAKTVTVGTGSPTAAFTVSPEPPVSTGTQVTFNAGSSEAVSGSSIVSYTWVFGDGTGSGPNATPTVNKTYAVANTYTVTLTVTDDVGRTATVSQAVTIQ